MPYPINPLSRLLLEDGASFLLLEDSTSRVTLDAPVLLDDPLDGATVSDTTPELTFVGSQQPTTRELYYYVDGNDGINDSSNFFSNDANAFDSSTRTTAASITATSANYLEGLGTDAPTSGDTISKVEAIIFYKYNYNSSVINTKPTLITAPSGGWTWAKLNTLGVRWVFTVSGSLNTAESVSTLEFRDGGTSLTTVSLPSGALNIATTAELYGVELVVTTVVPADVQYQVQLDASSFPADGGVTDSYSESNHSTEFPISTTGGSALGVGQSFIGDGYTIAAARFYLRKLGSPTGTAVARLYAQTGTYGTDSVATGSPLATSESLDVSTLTTSLQLITFNFTGANQVVMSNGTYYVIMVEHLSGTWTNTVNELRVSYDTTSPAHSGNTVYEDATGTFGANVFGDTIFYIDRGEYVPVNDYYSSTDLGFTDETLSLGDDRLLLEDGSSRLLLEDNTSMLVLNRDFPSGNYVSYTVQAADALDDGTYYWRVRRQASGGSWSDWSETRDFTVSTGGAPSTTGNFFLFM